jgi:hypothetical protein
MGKFTRGLNCQRNTLFACAEVEGHVEILLVKTQLWEKEAMCSSQKKDGKVIVLEVGNISDFLCCPGIREFAR